MPAIVCDRCGFRKDLLTAIGDEAARTAIAAALTLPPPLADATLRYLALFETPTRGLTWPRYAKALETLIQAMSTGSVTWKGNTRSAGPALWAQALLELVETTTLELPLRNHNYLKSMVFRKADSEEAKAETKRELLRQRHPAAARQVEHGAKPAALVGAESGPRSASEFVEAAKARLGRGGK